MTAGTEQSRSHVLWLAVPLLLALPFDPQWPDFERARRGILLIVAGTILVARGARASRPAAPLLALLGLGAAGLASAVWASDRLAALEEGGYLVALFALPLCLDAERERGVLANGCAIALIVTAGYGLLQCAGLNWPMHYSVPHEPVSTLGNRNVAAEWTAMAVPLALIARPALGRIAVIAAACYLWANGGRAGLIALHAAVGVWLVLCDRKAVKLAVPVLAGAAVAGIWLRPAPPAAAVPASDAASRAALAGPLGNTARVRLLTWPRTIDMTLDALPLGVGAGNFVARFPRYRDPREIALSSFDHRIGSRIKTPHNDVLQLLAELGLLGAALMLLFDHRLLRCARAGEVGVLAWSSLAAFAPLALFRSPLFNAPAACAWVVALGLGIKGHHAPPVWLRGVLRASGVGIAVLGVVLVLGEANGAGFLRAKRTGDAPAGYAAIDRAVRIDPFETDWRLFRSQVHHVRGKPVSARHYKQVVGDLEHVLARRPGEYRALLDVGYLGLSHTELRARGRQAILQLVGRLDGPRGLDPAHPVGLLLAANYACFDKDWDGALERLSSLRTLSGIDAGIRLLRGFRLRTNNVDEQIAIARRTLALKTLRQKLFPHAPELR